MLHSLQAVLELFQAEPLLAYALLSAVLLATVALGSGWSRRDALALLSLRGAVHLILSVSLAVALHRLAADLLEVTPQEQLLIFSVFLGLSRIPLYLLTLAYGPSSGSVAVVLFTLFVSQPVLVMLTLVLEMLILGYLAIAPSPFRYRWAAAFNLVLAYLLAQLTGGLALLLTQAGLSLEGILANLGSLQIEQFGGLCIALLLFLWLRPEDFSSVFPDSRIMPVQLKAQEKQQSAIPARVVLRLGQRRLVDPQMQARLPKQARSARDLEPFPFEITKPYQLGEK